MCVSTNTMNGDIEYIFSFEVSKLCIKWKNYTDYATEGLIHYYTCAFVKLSP